MATRCRACRFLIAFVTSLAAPTLAGAEAVRFRFVPGHAEGTVSQVPVGPEGAIGEWVAALGTAPKPYQGTFPPNRMVTFRHPYTSRNVTIPLKLPDNTPRIEHLFNRIRFNYGSYYVEARFLPDGAVDVVYNSGPLRPLPP
jgi:hypothetical protein